MKIVNVDNFNRDEVSDKLVCQNIDKEIGKEIVEFLNDEYSGSCAAHFYKLLPDHYRLYTWKP